MERSAGQFAVAQQGVSYYSHWSLLNAGTGIFAQPPIAHPTALLQSALPFENTTYLQSSHTHSSLLIIKLDWKTNQGQMHKSVFDWTASENAIWSGIFISQLNYRCKTQCLFLMNLNTSRTSSSLLRSKRWRCFSHSDDPAVSFFIDPCPYSRRWASAFCCARFRRLSLALDKKKENARETALKVA